MKPVLCLGDICADLIIPYAAAVRAKETGTLLPSGIDVRPVEGGSVANTACAIARLGLPVMFAGTCGNDAYGQMLKDGLERERVDTSLLGFDDDKPTQLVLLVLDESGDRTAFACPAHFGSQHAITPDRIPDDITDRISWLHVTGMMLREDPAATTQLDLMKKCRDAGIPVSFDVNVRVEALNDATFCENLQKAKSLASVILGSGIDEIPLLGGDRDPETAAKALTGFGASVIVRNGALGADLYDKDVRLHSPAFSVTVADTVGAGDTFDGAYIAAVLNGLGPIDAMREANAAAAICVSKRSGRACPTRAELDAFLMSHAE